MQGKNITHVSAAADKAKGGRHAENSSAERHERRWGNEGRSMQSIIASAFAFSIPSKSWRLWGGGGLPMPHCPGQTNGRQGIV